MRRQTFAKRLGERRQEPDRVGDDAKMSEIKNWRILVGVDRQNVVCAFDADAVLDSA